MGAKYVSGSMRGAGSVEESKRFLLREERHLLLPCSNAIYR